MAGPARGKDLELYGAAESCHIVVDDPPADPWKIVEVAPDGGRVREIAWEAVVRFPEQAPGTLVFEARNDAFRWMQERAPDYPWDVVYDVLHPERYAPQDGEMDQYERYVASAEPHAPGSPEAWRQAHDRGVLTNTLALFDQPGCPPAALRYVPPSNTNVRLTFQARSCRSTGLSIIYDGAWTKCWLGGGAIPCSDLPFGAAYAFTT